MVLSKARMVDHQTGVMEPERPTRFVTIKYKTNYEKSIKPFVASFVHDCRVKRSAYPMSLNGTPGRLPFRILCNLLCALLAQLRAGLWFCKGLASPEQFG
jgi:hypothetical protein